MQQLVQRGETDIERIPHLGRRLHLVEIVEIQTHSPDYQAQARHGVFVAQSFIQLTEIHQGRTRMVLDYEYKPGAQRTGEDLPGRRRSSALGRLGRAESQRAVIRKMKFAESTDTAQASRQFLGVSGREFVLVAAQPDARS